MKMDTLHFKKNMTKDEVALLVDLISNIPVLTNKGTNAATNKLKEEAWVSLAAEFNSKSKYIPRSLTQLKLKWDNLKKAARKRSQQIQRFNSKTGGNKSEFIPPDEILDRVSVLLEPSNGDSAVAGELALSEENKLVTHSTEARKRRIEDVATTKEIHCISKIGKPTHACTGKEKDTGAKERNLAIARYYEKKTEKLDLEIQLLKCRINSSKCNCNSPLQCTPIRWDDDDNDDLQ